MHRPVRNEKASGRLVKKGTAAVEGRGRVGRIKGKWAGQEERGDTKNLVRLECPRLEGKSRPKRHQKRGYMRGKWEITNN